MITINQCIDMFVLDRQARGLASGTLQFYRAKLALWSGVLAALGCTRLSDLTPTVIRQGLVSLASNHSKGGTAAAMRALRAMLTWWQSETDDTTWRNPLLRVKTDSKQPPPLPPISDDHIHALLSACANSLTGRRDRAIILTLLDTGCRASELIGLDMSDVDMLTGSVIVRHGKGDKARVVFVGAKCRRAISRYLNNRGEAASLFATDDGNRFTYWGLREVIRRLAGRASIPEPPLHSFRRAFCLHLVNNDVNILTVSRLMGHSNTTLVARYAAQTTSDLAAAHRRAGPVDRLL